MSEADIHFEFYRHLQNAIEEQPSRGSMTYGAVRPEYNHGISGRADLVIFDESDNPLLVIEAKRPGDETGRNIDPYSPDVIEQALEYATKLGAPYTATYNGQRLVLLQTLEPGRPFLERATKSYEVSDVASFADTLLDEVDRFAQNRGNWDSLDNAFIKRMRSLHEHLAPQLEGIVVDELRSDDDFRGEFTDWTHRQGINYQSADEEAKDEILFEFSQQAAYLLINKILFYKILENSPAYRDSIPSLAVSIHRVQADLADHFDTVVEDVDFEAIFEHDPVFDEVPLEPVGQKIRNFILELDDQDLTQFDSDVIGRIYEGVIPIEQRRELGEYYTPPAVCDLITQLTITSSEDSVLDPACGSGGFLISAYDRLQSLLAESRGSHERILNQLYGIDINRFPAHLTAINLALQNLSAYTESVNVEISDFFNISADNMRFRIEEADTSGSKQTDGVIEESVGGFDAVIGNPPYIRQENIPGKERVRGHLEHVDGESLSRRSDIYSYFITHATEFLREGGKLGFIISDRWLDTGYGEDLQEFILENYMIESIIKFDRQAFSDAMVGSTILILKKESDQTKRDNNITKFLRVQDSIDVEELESILKDDLPADQMIQAEHYRMVTMKQNLLHDESKWSVYFLAPPIYFEIYTHPSVGSLSSIADVGSGEKSGANAFFYRRREDWEQLGLLEYTSPLLKASGQLDKIRFDDAAAEEWGALDLAPLIQEAELELSDEFGDENPEDRFKRWLQQNGHTDLLEYIEQGEDQGYSDRATTSSRKYWFNLGSVERPDMFNTEFTWRIHRVAWNEAGAIATNQFHTINCEDNIDPKVLCGILNSRVSWLMCELRGRRAEGQGMTRSRMVVGDSKELPVVDPATISEENKARIVEALESLMEKEDQLGEDASLENTESKRDELDKAVLESINMEGRFDELKTAVQNLVAMREKRAGNRTQVLVERSEEGRSIIELEGVSQARESTTLDDF
ncbi:N-6 DNA methylase [Halorubrum ezzemoulense]|nr:N-6 DNA methylase [Halorubrum ezzemoulense]